MNTPALIKGLRVFHSLLVLAVTFHRTARLINSPGRIARCYFSAAAQHRNWELFITKESRPIWDHYYKDRNGGDPRPVRALFRCSAYA